MDNLTLKDVGNFARTSILMVQKYVKQMTKDQYPGMNLKDIAEELYIHNEINDTLYRLCRMTIED